MSFGRWLALGAVAAGALTVGLVGLTGSAASADVVVPAGACVATATWAGSGRADVSTGLAPGTVIEISRADDVAWSGRVVGPPPSGSSWPAGRSTAR